ncbi:hypothetical protein B0H16DRAFT_1832060 [Mycena metata]|uniref:Uncharacterized protein n=1 Tax=Mycena metata TaxID=1033252 RepID=A0AAD7DYT6_9AGAR|nr:hypothetical protein B0H16DRAFT_1832060 [Mycena metata]
MWTRRADHAYRELLRTRRECAREPERWRVAAMRRGLGPLTFRAFKTNSRHETWIQPPPGPGKLTPKSVRKNRRNLPQKATFLRRLGPQKATFGQGSSRGGQKKFRPRHIWRGKCTGSTTVGTVLVLWAHVALIQAGLWYRCHCKLSMRFKSDWRKVKNPSEKAKSRTRLVDFCPQKANFRTRKLENFALEKPKFRTDFGSCSYGKRRCLLGAASAHGSAGWGPGLELINAGVINASAAREQGGQLLARHSIAAAFCEHILLMLDIPPTLYILLLISLDLNIDWYLLYLGGTGGAGGQSHRQGGLGGPGEGPIVNLGHGYIEINHGIKNERMDTSGLLHRGHSRIWSPKHAQAQVARALAPKPPTPRHTGTAPAPLSYSRRRPQCPMADMPAPRPTHAPRCPSIPAAVSPSRSIRAACGVRSKRGKTRRRSTSARSSVVPVRAARCTSPALSASPRPCGVGRASYKTTRVVPVHTAAAYVCGCVSRARRPHPAPPALYAYISAATTATCTWRECDTKPARAWVEWNETNAPRGACAHKPQATSRAPAHKPYKHPRPRAPTPQTHKHSQDHAPPVAAYTPPPYTPPAPSISIRRQLQARASVPKRQVPKRKVRKESEREREKTGKKATSSSLDKGREEEADASARKRKNPAKDS